MTTARYYPASVRAIVHDGPGLPGGEELIDDALGTEVALNKIFSKCATDSACASAFPQLRSRFFAALPRLRQQPIIVGDKRFDDSEVVRFFRNWFYPRGYSTYEHRLQNLLVFLDAAARGDSQRMVEVQQRMRTEEFAPRKGLPPVPIYGQQSVGQNLSVYCNEKKPFESPDDYRKAIAKSQIVRSLLEGFDGPSDCALWPAGEADAIENTPVQFDGPQLAFTGELDASSSGRAGFEIAMLYANARNVVFKDGTHGQFPTELPMAEDRDYWMCALALGRQFFDEPQSKLDTRCAETRRFRLVR
jgi:pimeloyl-ACP methyl ester carboxylesterase